MIKASDLVANPPAATDALTYEQIKRAIAAIKGNNAYDLYQKKIEANRKLYDSAYSFVDKSPEPGSEIFVLSPEGWLASCCWSQSFDGIFPNLRWIYREVERNDKSIRSNL